MVFVTVLSDAVMMISHDVSKIQSQYFQKEREKTGRSTEGRTFSVFTIDFSEQ